MNDPIAQNNLNDMYAKVMEQDSNTWSAIQSLKDCKNTVEGFDYRVLYSEHGAPTALLYMTARMRYCLLRYGSIMFLDGQKRRYNKMDWNYIRPIIKNNENGIGVFSEDIVTCEDIDTYTWIFEGMVSIKPRWSPSKLKIIYVDGLISNRLLKI